MGYNLIERVKSFSFSVFDLIKPLRISFLNKNIVSQLLRAVSSVGANYAEAVDACSRKDFRNKIFLCKKEIHETEYWLEFLEHSNPELQTKLICIKQEAKELHLIFNKITYTLNDREKRTERHIL